jgi:hypothetical protein
MSAWSSKRLEGTGFPALIVNGNASQNLAWSGEAKPLKINRLSLIS